MYERRTRPLTDAERAEFSSATTRFSEALAEYLKAHALTVAVALIAIPLFWLWIRSVDRIVANIMLATVLLIAASSGVVGGWKHVRGRLERSRLAAQVLRVGELAVDHVEAERVAVADQWVTGTPAGGPLDAAQWFYDVGDGRFYYWLGQSDHLAPEPDYPRKSLRVTWLIPGQVVLEAVSSGDLLNPERKLPREPAITLTPGTLFPGTLETLEKDIERASGGNSQSK